MTGFLTLAELAAQLPKTVLNVPKLASMVVRKTAFDVVAGAQALVPVDTAATKNSIDARGVGGGLLADGDLIASVGPSTWYAPLLEYGTARMAPRPFMKPAADAAAGPFAAALGQVGAQALSGRADTYTTTSPTGTTYTGP